MNYTEIGNILEKHRTTISRDIKLGFVELETSYLPVWKYCAEVPQRKNEENETAKGTNLKIGKDMKLAKFIEKEIKEEKERIKSNKEAKTIGKALDKIERKLGVVKFRETFKRITTDNGGEFKNWKIIEKSYTGSKKARTAQYYADAYSSW